MGLLPWNHWFRTCFSRITSWFHADWVQGRSSMPLYGLIYRQICFPQSDIRDLQTKTSDFFWKGGSGLFGLLAVTFKVHFFLTARDLWGPYCGQYCLCCDAGNMENRSPCIIFTSIKGSSVVMNCQKKWPWKVTVSSSNEQGRICEKKSEFFFLRYVICSVTRSY